MRQSYGTIVGNDLKLERMIANYERPSLTSTYHEPIAGPQKRITFSRKLHEGNSVRQTRRRCLLAQTAGNDGLNTFIVRIALLYCDAPRYPTSCE